MNQIEPRSKCVLEANRKPDAFQNVPNDTEELVVTTPEPSEVTELSLLGHRLKRLETLTLRYGLLERLDFLESFRSIKALSVSSLADLKDFSGIGHCIKLTRLGVTASLSSVGSLDFLGHLSELESLSLEGPNPSKGMETVPPLQKVKNLRLYAPKWSIERLPAIFPVLENLWISQGSYRSLDFLASLDRLTTLEIYYARKLATFDAVSRLPSLRTLKIGVAISGLHSTAQFGHSSSIEKLQIEGCKQLKDVSSLSDWSSLKEMTFYNCPLIPDEQIAVFQKMGKSIIAE